MITVLPHQIPQIDAYAENTLGIPTRVLMERAGEGVAAAIAKRQGPCAVLIFCGGGNNGGDGYAAALALGKRGFSPLAVDVFGKGQKSEAGKHFLAAYTALYGAPLSLSEGLAAKGDILVDALFGTGFSGVLPREVKAIVARFQESDAYKVAVDIPLGVNGENGCLDWTYIPVDMTVSLCFVKQGLLSYPAKEAVGELVNCDLGLDGKALQEVFSLSETVEKESLAALLPPRAANSHKGSFGRVLGIVGSARYPGAALLAAEGALRAGCGLFTLASEGKVTDAALLRTPEILTLPLSPLSSLSESESAAVLTSAEGADAVLVGCGCGKSEGLCRLLLDLMGKRGAPLVIDADGLNALAEAREAAEEAFLFARRPLVLTPHPLELARLTGLTVKVIQENRLSVAKDFAARWRLTLVLKGAATVVASPEGEVSVSTVGSSALAKGGSGDVLAGVTAGLLAQGATPYDAARAAVFLHGRAADTLAARLSAYGVLPSDLPREIAGLIADTVQEK